MMPAIRQQLDIDYTQEGMIAASPDYGIVPGAILAIFVFQQTHWYAQRVLAVAAFGTSAACIFCALYPSLSTLVMTRAIGGLLWAQAATHYPVWINKRGPETWRTRSMASMYQRELVGRNSHGICGRWNGSNGRTIQGIYSHVDGLVLFRRTAHDGMWIPIDYVLFS